MDKVSYKTKFLNKDTVKKEWVVVDAADQVLGRLCSQVAVVLRGKHKASYTPHVDCGDNVIIINAEKIKLTGNKMTDKVIAWYTGYPGGYRTRTPEKQIQRDASMLLEDTIRGMLPKTRLGRAIFGNLHVYAGTAHKHEAQNPKAININDIK